MTTTTLAQGLFIVALRSYTLSADAPFAVRCEYNDGAEAPLVNAESTMSSTGKYIVRFEVAGKVKIFVNGSLVCNVPEMQGDDNEVSQC